MLAPEVEPVARARHLEARWPIDLDGAEALAPGPHGAAATAGSVASMRISAPAAPKSPSLVGCALTATAEPVTAAATDEDQQAEHQELLAPVAPEQAPRPAGDGPPGRRAHGRPAGGEQRLGPGGRAGLVDDAAVAEEHDAVGPRRELGVVGDDDAGGAAPACVAEQPHDGLAVHRVERAGRLVGEQQAALADDARAIATRWRSPPDRSSGKWSARSARPSSSSAAERGRRAPRRRRAVELQRHRHVLGRGEAGEQVEVLEHEADRPPAQPGPLSWRDIPPTATPPTSDLAAASASSRLPAMVSSVLLPEPLGPMTATSSPAATVRSTSRSACTSAGAVAVDLATRRAARARRSRLAPVRRGGAVRRRARVGRRESLAAMRSGARDRRRRTSAVSSQRTAASSRNSSASTTSASATSSSSASALTAVYRCISSTRWRRWTWITSCTSTPGTCDGDEHLDQQLVARRLRLGRAASAASRSARAARRR